MNKSSFTDFISNLTGNWSNICIDISIKGTLLLIIALVLCFFLKKSTSKLRYFILLNSVFGILLFPLLNFLFRSLNVTLNAPAPLSLNSRHLSSETIINPSLIVYGSDSVVDKASKTGYLSFELIAFIIWFIGFTILTVRLIIGIRRSRILLSDSEIVSDTNIKDCYDSVRMSLKIKRDVKLYFNSQISSPMTFRQIHPVILFPSQSVNWDKERINIILIHEMCHIKRMDNIVSIITRIILALAWFNPLLWVAVGKLRMEQENSCDEYIINSGIKPHRYASHLFDIAKSLYYDNLVSRVVNPLAHAAGIEKRIMFILDTSKKDYKKISISVITMILLLVTTTLSSVKLISFDNLLRVYPSQFAVRESLISVNNSNLKISNALPSDLPISNPILGYFDSNLFNYSYLTFDTNEGNFSGISIDKGNMPLYIASCADGKVIKTGSGKGGSYIIISHNYGITSVYSNLSEIFVKEGQSIYRNNAIGCTGKNRKMNLAFKINDKFLDPVSLLQANIE